MTQKLQTPKQCDVSKIGALSNLSLIFAAAAAAGTYLMAKNGVDLPHAIATISTAGAAITCRRAARDLAKKL